MRRARGISRMTAAGAAIGLVLLLGGAGWLARSSAQRTAALEREIALLQARRGEVEATRQDLERRIRAATDALATAKKALAHVEAEERSVKETQPGRTLPPAKPRAHYDEDLAQIIEATRNNPEVRRAEDESYKTQLRVQYADLARKLGWSQEVTERFVANVGERSMQHQELLAAARSLGVSDYDPVVAALYGKDDAAYRTTQRALIGEDGVREMLRYDETMSARNLASAFAGMATLADLPLARPQVEALAEIIARETRTPPRGPFPIRIDTDWERVDAAAQAILSERQLALFQWAESPGMGRGGSRFMKQLNHAIMAANYQDAMGGR